MELNRIVLIVSSIDTANTLVTIASAVIGIITTSITTAIPLRDHRHKKAEAAEAAAEQPKLWTPGDPDAGSITVGLATAMATIGTIAWYLG